MTGSRFRENLGTLSSRCKQEHMDPGISSSLSKMLVTSPPSGTACQPHPSTQTQTPTVIQLQIGLFKEVVCVSSTQLNFHYVKKLASQIIERKAPECTIIGNGEKILLFRHEPNTAHLLRHLNSGDILQHGDLVEVVLSGSATVTEMKLRPHTLVVQSYRTPTFCHHCGEMLWGLVRQGLKCEGCGLDFHKRCALLLPSDCSRVRRRCGPSLSLFPPGRPRASSLSAQTGGGGSLEEISILKSGPRSRPPSWAERPVWLGVGQGDRGRPQVPHTFHIHSYTKPTMCQHCHRLLKGLFRQGLQCSDCKFNCHRRCEPLVPNDCLVERRTTNGADNEVSSSYNMETDEDLDLPGSSSTLDCKDDEPLLNEDPFTGYARMEKQTLRK